MVTGRLLLQKVMGIGRLLLLKAIVTESNLYMCNRSPLLEVIMTWVKGRSLLLKSDLDKCDRRMLLEVIMTQILSLLKAIIALLSEHNNLCCS